MIEDHRPLKLLAEDLEDLKILAAHLQDAIVHLSSLHFNSEENKFSLLTNRFCWEKDPHHHEDGKVHYHRIHSGIIFSHVQDVHFKGFQRHKELQHDGMFNLLTIDQTDNFIHIIFAHAKEIRLGVEKVKCHLHDIHHPWLTPHMPTHLHEHLGLD